MATSRKPINVVTDGVAKYNVRTSIGECIVMGLSDERTAARLGLDRMTVAKRRKELQAAWAGELQDTQSLRGFLFQMALDLYRLAREDYPNAPVRTQPAFLREARGSIQAMLDVTGLRTLRVDIGSSQFAGLLAGLVQLQAGPVVEGDCKVIEET